MAEKKKKKQQPKKKNIIDTSVGKVRSTVESAKKTVAGSKEVAKAKGKVAGVAAKAKEKARTLRGKAPSAADVQAKAADVQSKVAGAASTAKEKVIRPRGAAAANERIAARAAGPQQGTPFRAQPAGGGRTADVAPPPPESARSRARNLRGIETATTSPKAPPPQRSLTSRGLRATGRTARKYGGPAAIAAGTEGLIRYGADIGDRGFDVATGKALESGREFVEELPGAAAQFGRDVINRPLRTGVGVGAGILDTAANLGLTIGDVGKAAVGDQPFSEGFREAQEQTRSLRDPFGRALEAISPYDQTQQATVPGTEQPLPGAQQPVAGAGAPGEVVAEQPSRGLRGAMSNREFLADEAGKFRSGFDVLEEAGVRKTGGIGDLAQYNVATGIAKRANSLKKAARELNVSEAEARANIESGAVTNALNLSKIDKNLAATDSAFRKDVAGAGEAARGILEKYNAYQEEQRSAWGDSPQALANIEAYENNLINNALGSAWDPRSPDSQAASHILGQQMQILADKGLMEGLYDAATDPDFDLSDIMNDNGEINMNRETMQQLSITPNGTVALNVPRTDSSGNIVNEDIPLFALEDAGDKFAKQLMMITGGSQRTRTLQSGQ